MNKMIMAALAAGWAVSAATTLAEEVSLTANDASGTSSFNAAGKWSDGSAPTNGNDYVVGGSMYMRSPVSGAFEFAGDTLSFTNSACLLGKGATSLTASYILDKGVLYQAPNSAGTVTIDGTVLIGSGGGLFAVSQSSTMDVGAVVSGSGDVSISLYDNTKSVYPLGITPSDASVVSFSATNTYTGNTTIHEGTFNLTESGALTFAIGALGINNQLIRGENADAVNLNGAFMLDLSAAGTSIGDVWTLVDGEVTYGDTFELAGFLDNGDGTWYLEGAAANYKYFEEGGLLKVVSANITPIDVGNIMPHNLSSGVYPKPEISITIYDGSYSMVTDSAEMRINGVSVVPSVSEEGPGTNVVSYLSGTAFESGTNVNVQLTYWDSSYGYEHTNSWSFSVASYSDLTAQALSLEMTSQDGAARGFWYRDVSWTTDNVLGDPSIAGVSDALSALHYEGAYTAALDNSPVESNYTFSIVAPYNLSENFSSNNVIDLSDSSANDLFEGGDAYPFEWVNFADEILCYLELDAGIHTLGFNQYRGSAALWIGDRAFEYFASPETAVLNSSDDGCHEFTVQVTESGLYPVRIVHSRYQDWSAGFEFYSVKADGSYVLINDTENGGIPAWRVASREDVAYTKSMTPAPGSQVIPLQDISVELGGNFDYSSMELWLNGTLLSTEYDYLLDSETEIAGVEITADDILAINESNAFELVYTDVNSGGMYTNSWYYDVANYVAFLEGTPSGEEVVASPLIEATLLNYTGTLKTDTLVMTLDGASIAYTPTLLNGTNTLSYQSADLEPGIHNVQLIWEANEGGGVYTNAWIFEVEGIPEGAVCVAASMVGMGEMTPNSNGLIVTTASFDMNGGTAVALVLTEEAYEATALASATFAGQEMVAVHSASPVASGYTQRSTIFYLLNPAVTEGIFEVTAPGTSDALAYSAVSLSNAVEVTSCTTASSTSKDNGTPLDLSYSTVATNSYIVTGAVNNDYNLTRTFSLAYGNADEVIRSFVDVGTSGHYHAGGAVSLPGSYTDGFYGQYQRSAIAGVVFSPEYYLAPDVPMDLVATAVSNQVDLTWAALEGTDSYNVKRAETAGGPYTTIATGLTVTEYTDTELDYETTYYYVVSGTYLIKEGYDSEEVAATTEAAPVTEGPVVGAAMSDGTLLLSWPSSYGESFNVLTNADLMNTAGWGDAGQAPALNGDNYEFSIPVGSESTLFYKLESN